MKTGLDCIRTPSRSPSRHIHVVHFVSELARGGTERVLLDLLERLDPKIFLCTVVSTGGPDAAATVSRFAASGIRTARLPVRLSSHATRGFGARRLAGKLQALWQLERWLRRIRPDIVHTHGPANNVYGVIAARLAGVRRVIAHDHNPVPGGMRARLAARATAPLLHATCAVSNTVAASRSTHLGDRSDRVVLVANGVDLHRFHPPSAAERAAARRRLGLPPEALVVGSAGRFVPWKRFDLLMGAFARLQVEPAHLLLAGDGPERDRLWQRARQLGIETKVSLPGWIDDIRVVYWSLDIFAMTSDGQEGFGLAAAEAMACGRPVVATRTPLFADILDSGAARLAEPDTESVAGALADLAAAPDRTRLGAIARCHAERRFDIDMTARRLETLYLEAVASGPAPAGRRAA